MQQRRIIAADINQAAAARAGVQDSRLQVRNGNSDVKSADSEVVVANANLAAAGDRYTLAETTVKRNAPLAADKYISREEFDQYETARDNALQSLNAAKEQVKIAEQKLNSSKTKHDQNEVNVSKSVAMLRRDEYSIPLLDTLLAERPARQSAVDQARLNLKHAHIYAPFGGCIVALNIAEGAYARPGSALFTLIDENSWYVDADFREAQLVHIRPGMHADVFLMSDPHYALTGIVQSISSGVSSSDSSSEGGTPGTPGGLPVVQRSLNWVRLASRYAVRIRFRPRNGSSLRIGTTAEIAVRADS